MDGKPRASAWRKLAVSFKYCQSCGFPLKKDRQGGGTEADGSISIKYCSMCYKQGKFLTPSSIDSPQKMQAFCIDQMKSAGYNGLIAWLATRSIPRLERWRNH
ncbi:MAG: hypothetical protein FGM33_06150 [Candidatus Kapabacteria bacterium]|nr:hypothetical protein [Candidatus Kapabacteria bacterium]